MASEDKHPGDKNVQYRGSNATETGRKSGKPGMVKRFLEWIAKGAEKTALQKPTCSA